MDAWQLWQQMAHESEEAARLAEAGGCLRPAASRYYYPAYQAVTALLLFKGLIPPAEREAWGHIDTPQLLQDQLQTLIRSRARRDDLAQRLVDLYRLRIAADYEGAEIIGAGRVQGAGKGARYVLRVMGDLLPER